METPAAPKLSVILPVFNGGKTLHKSVASIRVQSFHDFELIIVDDGSQDDSLHLARNLAKADRRISVVSKRNGGVSSARNSGLAVAQGVYVTFMDADDTLEGRAYEEALDLLEDETVDLAIFGMKGIFLVENRVANVRSAGVDGIWNIDAEAKSFPFFELIRAGLLMSANNKVYRRHVIQEYCIAFDEATAIMEDFGFVLDYLSCVKRVRSMSAPHYCHFRDLAGPVLRPRPNIDYVQNFANLETKLIRFSQKIGTGDRAWELQLRSLIFRNYILGGDYQIWASVGLFRRWQCVRSYYRSPRVVLAAERSDGRSRSERAIRWLTLSQQFGLLSLFLLARRFRMELGHRFTVLRARIRLTNRAAATL